jgi:hypothetical protein
MPTENDRRNIHKTHNLPWGNVGISKRGGEDKEGRGGGAGGGGNGGQVPSDDEMSGRLAPVAINRTNLPSNWVNLFILCNTTAYPLYSAR